MVIVGLSACGVLGTKKSNKKDSNGPASSNPGPVVTKVPPKDHKKFDEIFGVPADEVHDKEIEFLKAQNHDLEWYQGTLATLVSHDSVQVIYFGSAERVIGWCSGAFLDADRIATAGHCHSDEYRFDLEVGKGCRGKVVFAIKENASSKVDYYECDKLEANEFSIPDNPNASGELKDYAVFSLKSDRQKNVHYPLGVYYQLGELNADPANFTTLYTDKLAVGVFVDPPKGYGEFASSYDIVPGKIVAKAFETEATYIEPFGNSSQPGNSGGPFYVIEDVTFDFATDSIETENFGYLAPNYGRFWGTTLQGSYKNLSVISNTAIIVDDFLDGF